MRTASRTVMGPLLLLLGILFVAIMAPVVFGEKPPKVLISYPIDGSVFRASELVELNASESYDPDGKAITFLWSSNVDGELGYGDVLKVRLSPGGHTITCEVTDADGETTEETRQVTILPLESPMAKLEADKISVEIFEIVTFDASGSLDPDFSINDYRYTFGDGNGTDWIRSNITSHSFDFPGQYTVRLEVRDTDGLTDSTNLTIEVRGRRIKTSEGTNITTMMILLILFLVLVIAIMLVVFHRVRKNRRKNEEAELRRRMDRRAKKRKRVTKARSGNDDLVGDPLHRGEMSSGHKIRQSKRKVALDKSGHRKEQ